MHSKILEKLGSLITESYNEMVTSSVNYAEKNEVADRHKYFIHKNAFQKLNEFKQFYLEELDSFVNENKSKQVVSEVKEEVKEDKKVKREEMADNLIESGVSLGSNLKKKSSSSKEETKTVDSPKKSASKRGRPKKGGESKK